MDLCQEFGGERRPGPLHLFVNGRRLFALQLYLLLLCLAKGDPWDKEMSGTSWALALDQQGPGAESKVSRNWSWLAGNNLVRTERRGRHLQVFRLHESGNGGEFTRPTGHFFYFPFAYFTTEWHTKLSLAATATLLISLSSSRNKPWFALPSSRQPTGSRSAPTPSAAASTSCATTAWSRAISGVCATRGRGAGPSRSASTRC